ncbi:DUF4167 domain-containing protein [Sphingopyxis sp. XHP0097]|uniref:DUF4167 domain-containing protein n=1 Tax=Sphingopyxis jiangsuensis TaxID=2871171 RepID=A0ABS7M990_9SPHN|nr:DUF4167 domain-containing protein [Sphingopyxis jiangsuensis]
MSQLNMNNRQSGRRRGRNNSNNNRSQSGGRGGVDQANRIDSRARGNAAQMIEKYRNMARDAQLAGDRVQTEYYLQFADHYFRVVSDFRARQEEKAAQSGQDRSHDRQREIRGVEDFDGHDDSDLDTDSGSEDNDGDARGNRDRRDRDDDDSRGNRQQQGRGDRGRRNRDSDRAEAKSDDDSEEAASDEEQAPAPRAPRRGPRRARAAEKDDGDAGIDTAVLPPAIGRTDRTNDEAADSETDEAPAAAPKARRSRRTLAPRGPGVEAAE